MSTAKPTMMIRIFAQPGNDWVALTLYDVLAEVLIEYIVCVGGWEGRAPLERFGGSRHLTRELFIHMDTPEFM